MILGAIVHRRRLIEKDPNELKSYLQEARCLTEKTFARFQRGIDHRQLAINAKWERYPSVLEMKCSSSRPPQGTS